MYILFYRKTSEIRTAFLLPFYIYSLDQKYKALLQIDANVSYLMKNKLRNSFIEK